MSVLEEENNHRTDIVSSNPLEDVENILDSKLSATLALDNGVVRTPENQYRVTTGDLVLGDIEDLEGDFVVYNQAITGAVTQDIKISETDEYGFLVSDSQGYGFEVKRDDSYDLGDENLHIHARNESYAVLGGSLKIGVPSENFPADAALRDESDLEQHLETYEISEGEILEVPPKVPHKVLAQKGDPTHLVSRYGAEPEPAKYLWDGTQEYGNIDDFNLRTQEANKNTL